jgi:hypothetical protein
MAGTLFGLGLSPQFDANGDLARGALLYVYAANTSTPADTYSDFDLASEHAWPLEADAAGRLPAFWVEDGSYRARLTTADDVTIFDEPSITSLGASSGSDGGGGDSGTSDFITGDMLWVPVDTTRAAWVRSNGRTIGSAASSATERANADTEDLYEFLWTNYSDSLCPVDGGRGGSAAADFAANKAIGTLDMRGRSPFGLDTMGNSAASVLSGATTAGGGHGAATTSITIDQANLPNVNLSSASLTITGTPSLTGSPTNLARNLGESGFSNGGTQAVDDYSETNLGVDAGDLDVGGNVPLGGSGTALTPAIIPPARVGTWYMRL